jgi:hypothetical protein
MLTGPVEQNLAIILLMESYPCACLSQRLGGLSYFAGAEKKDDRVLVPDLGSLTSVHDRARELFYYLKGGRVDYGEEHSKMYGHDRFGRSYHRGENRSISFICVISVG